MVGNYGVNQEILESILPTCKESWYMSILATMLAMAPAIDDTGWDSSKINQEDTRNLRVDTKLTRLYANMG